MRPLFSFVAAASLLVGCAADSSSPDQVDRSSVTVARAQDAVASIDGDLPGCDDAAARAALGRGSQVKLTAIRSTDLVIASTVRGGVCVDTLPGLKITHPWLFRASVDSNPMPGTDPAASNPMPGDDKGGSNPMPGTGR